MTCTSCHHENPSGLKFCGECGVRLSLACPSCGAANSPEQKFCGECGAKLRPDTATARPPSPLPYTPKHLAEKILGSKSTLEGERKQVPVLFADLKSSMELLADHNPSESIGLTNRALEHSRTRKECGVEAWPSRLLGEVGSRRDAPAASTETAYMEAMALADKLGMRPLVAHCHLGMGQLPQRIGHLSEARTEFSQATELYRQMDMQFYLRQAEEDLKAVD